MNINKNNYQEFLLLYIDGELAVDVEKEVEFFIAQNANAKQEFDLLLATKLQLDEVSFGDISLLLKNENVEISVNNYEEKFCLYVDNELSKNDRKKVETYVLQHPTLQADFTTLNKTKLPLQTIEYRNKKELYKKEKTIIFYLQKLQSQ